MLDYTAVVDIQDAATSWIKQPVRLVPGKLLHPERNSLLNKNICQLPAFGFSCMTTPVKIRAVKKPWEYMSRMERQMSICFYTLVFSVTHITPANTLVRVH